MFVINNTKFLHVLIRPRNIVAVNVTTSRKKLAKKLIVNAVTVTMNFIKLHPFNAKAQIISAQYIAWVLIILKTIYFQEKTVGHGKEAK